MTVRRSILIAGSIGLPLALLVLLFAVLGVTFGDFVRTMGRTPMWLLALLPAIALANQMISVIRWRAAARWLNPKAEPVGWGRSLEATVWGSFLGQFLPLQLSMALARWASVRNRTTVGATLYEQLFDLVILLAGASAAALLLVLRGNPSVALAALAAAVFAGCLSIRWLFRIAGFMASKIAAAGLPGAGWCEQLREPLGQASRAPARLLAVMAGLSALRLVLLAFRVTLVASVFIGAMHFTTVVIGYPIVGLALGAPFVPAGLGVADWSLTGILVLAGAAAPSAAMAAAAVRVLNAYALGVLLIVLFPLRLRAAHRGAMTPVELPG